jgi:hypothetical protein
MRIERAKPQCEAAVVRGWMDYMLRNVAVDALALAGDMFPDTRPQVLLDKMVITAVSALVHDRDHKRWESPRLWGRDRDAWKLPEALRPENGP